MKRIILGISGASGVVYGQRMLDVLERSGCEVHVMVTEPGAQILRDELGAAEMNCRGLMGRESDTVRFYDNRDMFSLPASGSFLHDGMVVGPCSSHTLASIAAGLADTLLLRSAYVSLKQRRPLVIVHREMPLSLIDLENMSRITQAGGIICPASPAFYAGPQTIADMVDTVVGKALDLLAVEHDLRVRWEP